MNFNINFKTPVLIKNALPCNLKIRTDIILGKLSEKQKAYKTNSNEENFEFEMKEITVQKGHSVKLHNYNLKSDV